MSRAAEILREVAKGYELQAEACRERETLPDELHAAQQLSIAVTLVEVAAALEQEAA